MTEALTIGQAGAEGVERAIADGMLAADYARQLETARTEMALLAGAKAALEDENDMLRAENARLRKQCRNYRGARSAAYRAALDRQADSGQARDIRWRDHLIAMLAGMSFAFAITTAIIWAVGIR